MTLGFGDPTSEVPTPRFACLDDDEQFRIWRVVLDQSAICSRSRARGWSFVSCSFHGPLSCWHRNSFAAAPHSCIGFRQANGPTQQRSPADIRPEIRKRSVPGPPTVTIPRITVVARSSVRSVEIFVAINPPGDGPSHIWSIAVARLVADDLRGLDQRIRSRLAMAQKRRRIGMGSNQKAGRQHGRTDRSHVSFSPSREFTSCFRKYRYSKIQDQRLTAGYDLRFTGLRPAPCFGLTSPAQMFGNSVPSPWTAKPEPTQSSLPRLTGC